MDKKDISTLTFAFSVILVILGVVAIIFAEAIATAIPYIIGAVILVCGICTFFDWLMQKNEENNLLLKLIESLVCIVLGILVIVFADISVLAFVIIVAICVIFRAMLNLYVALVHKKIIKGFGAIGENQQNEGLNQIDSLFTISIIKSVVEIVFAILLLVFCNSALKIIVTILGAGVVAIALYMLITQMLSLRKNKDEILIETTAEIVDENNEKEETNESN